MPDGSGTIGGPVASGISATGGVSGAYAGVTNRARYAETLVMATAFEGRAHGALASDLPGRATWRLAVLRR
jgi:hypothetical protein